jgi:hypothetical protein
MVCGCTLLQKQNFSFCLAERLPCFSLITGNGISNIEKKDVGWLISGVNLTELREFQMAGKTFLVVSGSVFLTEISI